MRITGLFCFLLCLAAAFPAAGAVPPDGEESAGRYCGGLMEVSEEDGHYYCRIPLRLLGRDFLVTTTVLEASARGKRYGEQRYGYAGDRLDAQVIRMAREGKRLLLLQPYPEAGGGKSAAGLEDLLAQRGEGCIVAALDICREDEAGITVDLRGLLEDNSSLFGLKNFEMELGIGRYLPKSSFLKEIVSHPSALIVRFVRSYMSVNFVPDPEVRPAPTRWEYGVSLSLLPEVPMQRRKTDGRVGYFTASVPDYRSSAVKVGQAGFVTRWRLEPREGEVEDYLAGKPVEPRRPIIFYIDRNTPEWLRPFFVRAVEDWQPAFEEAGFLNAIQARMEPEAGVVPDYEVDNGCYSYISYKASPIGNAYGPSTVDPRSGEILCSHIGVFNTIADNVQNLYFCQAGAVDARARETVLPDSLLGRLVQYVVCHEVGHTLGLKHNFRGSAVYGTDRLRDKDFVHANGFGSSIMDYMRFNFAVQPGDGMDFEDMVPRIGAYDRFAISWGYRYYPDEAAAESLHRQWTDGQMADSLLWYNGEDDIEVCSQGEDLGADQLSVNALGIANMKRLMASPCWKTGAEGTDRLVWKGRYRTLIFKFQEFVNQALSYIGGRRSLMEKGGRRLLLTAVPHEKELEALRFLDAHVFNPPVWLYRDDLFKTYRIDARLNLESLFMQTVYTLLDKLGQVGDGTVRMEMLAELRSMLFREWEEGRHTGPERKNLQRLYVGALKSMAAREHADCSFPLILEQELEDIAGMARNCLDRTEDRTYMRGMIAGINNWRSKQK